MKTLLIILSLMGPQAWGHSRLKAAGNIPPRDANAGLKSAPCGGVAKTSAPRILQAGSTVTVDWEETVNHPGRFEFYFSNSGDTNWQLLKVVPDTQDGGGLPHQYSTTLELPTTTCNDCSLQMIQVMTENPASPRNYYSCADLQLTPGATLPPPPPGTPLPPAPPAEPDCH